MKKLFLVCVLSVLTVCLFSAGQAAAFSYLGCTNLPNYGNDAERDWLNTLVDPDVPAVAKLTEFPDGFSWSDPFTYEGRYVMLKIGEGSECPNPDDCAIFAFEIEPGDSFSTYGDLIDAMYAELVAEGAYDCSKDQLVDDASHISAAVPIPAAAWLLGSGILGLVGIRWRSRKKVS